MKRAVVFVTVFLAACGGDDTARHPPDAPRGCTTSDCNTIASTFSGLHWELPCGSVIDTYDCSAPAPQMMTATVGGTGSYSVTLHFLGVVEQKTYTGGTTDGYWNVGGTPATTDNYNVYSLTTSSPAQTYYLNAGTSGIGRTWPLDYQETIAVDAGATITLVADSLEGVEILNIDDMFMPVSAPGATLVTQPYNGQFIQMDVADIVAK